MTRGFGPWTCVSHRISILSQCFTATNWDPVETGIICGFWSICTKKYKVSSSFKQLFCMTTDIMLETFFFFLQSLQMVPEIMLWTHPGRPWKTDLWLPLSVWWAEIILLWDKILRSSSICVTIYSCPAVRSNVSTRLEKSRGYVSSAVGNRDLEWVAGGCRAHLTRLSQSCLKADYLSAVSAPQPQAPVWPRGNRMPAAQMSWPFSGEM